MSEFEDIDAELQRNNESIQKLATRNHELLERKKILLEFNKDKWTVRWHNGFLKLSKKRFQILTVLYFADNRQMTITDLETAIWDEASHSTIRSTVSRLDAILNDSGIPFYIESLMSEGGFLEISDRKGRRTVKIRPTLSGFQLVSRVATFCNASQILGW